MEYDVPAVTTDFYESRLVERLQRGDADSMSTLFDMHVDRVYAYARHMLGNREDAEEVTSEAFLKAFRRAAEFRGDAPFHAWLFGITRNACRDRMRQPRLISFPIDDLDAFQPDESDRMALRADVRNAVNDLPGDYKDVLILCDVEEWDAAEAATVLGRSTAATKSLLYRARGALRDQLNARWKE
jgi:RNA polymerase sigma-70 factor (ECF subfamily)